MKNNETNITFTEDIIKEVAKEFGVTYREAMAIYDTEIKYIKHLMKQDDTFALKIPYIGIMHVNRGMLYKSILTQERYKNSGYDIDEEKYERNKLKLERVQEFQKERKESDAKGKTTHAKKVIFSMLRKRFGKTWEEIEEIQKKEHGED